MNHRISRRHANTLCGRRTLTALLLIFTVAASACSASTSDSSAVSSETGEAAQTQVETAPDEPQPQDQSQSDSSSQTAPAADGSFGPKPISRTFKVSPQALTPSGAPLGIGYTFTEIDSRDAGVLYLALGDDNGVQAALLDEGLGQLTVCGNSADGCGDGSADQSFLALGAFDVWNPMLAFGPLRTPNIVEVGPFGGWDVIDENYSHLGRPGRCYRSTGQDDTGQPTEYPAGDVLCTVKVEFTSQFLVSYDYGGDGVFELDTIDMHDSFSNADLVLPAEAAGADQAGLDRILDNTANLPDYDLLG